MAGGGLYGVLLGQISFGQWHWAGTAQGIFTGGIISAWCASYDLLLLPSDGESFGLAALEAMACGVPTLATSAGGVPEVIEDGVTGLLSDVGNVEEMVSLGAALLADPERLCRFREAARRRAQELFSIEQIVDQYEALYRRL